MKIDTSYLQKSLARRCLACCREAARLLNVKMGRNVRRSLKQPSAQCAARAESNWLEAIQFVIHKGASKMLRATVR